MKRVTHLAIAATVLIALSGAWHQLTEFGASAGERVEVLDPAKIELIRTPGGFLQVSAMEKVEEFAWRTTWECPLVDCTNLPKTVSRVQVKAQYVYRIPLAAEWRLETQRDHYRLSVPPVQLQAPVAFDTTTMKIVTTEKSMFSPATTPNRENALRHLGPELAQRGATPAYIDAQRTSAEQTVREFAQKWMREQGRKLDRPIQVGFTGPSPF